jgi:hypothetical protein
MLFSIKRLFSGSKGRMEGSFSMVNCSGITLPIPHPSPLIFKSPGKTDLSCLRILHFQVFRRSIRYLDKRFRGVERVCEAGRGPYEGMIPEKGKEE